MQYKNLRGARPESGVSDGNVGSVKRLLNSTDPAAVYTAGTVHHSVAQTVRESYDALRKQADDLDGHWHDDASIEVQQAMQKLHATGIQLVRKMEAVGQTLQTYSDSLKWYRENALDDSGLGSWANGIDVVPGDWGGDHPEDEDGASYWTDSPNSRARNHLENLNKQIVQLYDDLPDRLEYDLPQVASAAPPTLTNQPNLPGLPDTNGNGFNGSVDPTAFNGSGGPGSGNLVQPGLGSGNNGSGAFPNGSGTDPSGSGPSGSDLTDPANLPNGTDGSGGSNPNDPRTTSLAGVDPTTGLKTPANPNGLNMPTGLSGTPATTAPSGLGTGPLGTGPLGTSPLGTSPLGGSGSYGNGTGGAGQGSGARANLASGPMGGMPFMPMGGGAGGEGNQERERSTWLTEDENVWGGDAPVAPGVIC